MKYLNLKLAIDSESVNVYVETGGEPVHVVYWHMDEWLEDAESSVPATVNAVHLFHTNPDELIEKVSGAGVPDIKKLLFTSEDVENFTLEWGQSHRQICDALGYDPETSDDLLVVDYFWMPVEEIWCPKIFNDERVQMIADYLRHKE